MNDKPEFCYNKNITNRYLNDYYDKTDNIIDQIGTGVWQVIIKDYQ